MFAKLARFQGLGHRHAALSKAAHCNDNHRVRRVVTASQRERRRGLVCGWRPVAGTGRLECFWQVCFLQVVPVDSAADEPRLSWMIGRMQRLLGSCVAGKPLNLPPFGKANCAYSSGSRTQKSSERFQRRFRYVMFNSFGVSFSSFDGYAHCEKYIHDESMPGSYSYRQLQSAFGQKDTTIGAGRCHPFPLQPGDGFYGGHVGNAEAACNICWTCLAGAGEQVSDELNVVLEQSCRLGRTSLTEAACLYQLCRKL